MADTGSGNRRNRKAGILVRGGRNQSLGAGHQLGNGNSRVADNSHAQSMAEPRIKSVQDIVWGRYLGSYD